LRPWPSGSPKPRAQGDARLWAKREEQIHGVVETMAGLYGDLQGIAGRSLQEIAGLEVPLLDGPPASEATFLLAGPPPDVTLWLAWMERMRRPNCFRAIRIRGV
jgi:hypothetical protein